MNRTIIHRFFIACSLLVLLRLPLALEKASAPLTTFDRIRALQLYLQLLSENHRFKKVIGMTRRIVKRKIIFHPGLHKFGHTVSRRFASACDRSRHGSSRAEQCKKPAFLKQQIFVYGRKRKMVMTTSWKDSGKRRLAACKNRDQRGGQEDSGARIRTLQMQLGKTEKTGSAATSAPLPVQPFFAP
jgi:hypothetical protein